MHVYCFFYSETPRFRNYPQTFSSKSGTNYNREDCKITAKVSKSWRTVCEFFFFILTLKNVTIANLRLYLNSECSSKHFRSTEDPAKSSALLHKTLEENRKIARKNLEKTLDWYSQEQDRRRRKRKQESDDDENEEPRVKKIKVSDMYNSN